MSRPDATPPDRDRAPAPRLERRSLAGGEGRGPLYHQLKEHLRDRIESGEWQPGHRLPSERELCETFDVSRATTTQALRDLERIGLVERIQGKGSFVARPKLVQDLLGFYTFTEQTLAHDLVPVIKVLSIEVAAPTTRQAAELRIDLSDKVIRVERLKLVNGEPVVFDVSALPRSLCPGLEKEDLETNLLHDVLSEKFGVRMVEQEKWVEPVVLDDYEAGLLRTKRGALGLQVERVAYAEGRRPVEFRRILVPGNRCKYVVEVTRP